MRLATIKTELIRCQFTADHQLQGLNSRVVTDRFRKPLAFCFHRLHVTLAFSKQPKVYDDEFATTERHPDFVPGHGGHSWNCSRLEDCVGIIGSIRHLNKLCIDQRLDEAFQLVDLTERQEIPISKDVAYCLLQGCTRKKDLTAARHVHSLMASAGLDSVSFLGDHLIRLFALCGSLAEANRVFWKISNPSVYTWNAIISAHTRLGESERAMELYDIMLQEGVVPDNVTVVCMLKACSNLGAENQGEFMHEQIIRNGLESNIVVGSALVDMYAKCRNLREARSVFNDLSKRDVVVWGAMIAAYAQQDDGIAALELFEQMQRERVTPNIVIFSCILKACGSIQAIEEGRLIHYQISRCELESDVIIGSTLVDMYVKCGSITEARKVFDGLQIQDVVSWGTMISGYVIHGQSFRALQLFDVMQRKGITPNAVILGCILRACGSIEYVEHGRLIHCQIIMIGLELDMLIGNTLIDMYARNSFLNEARNLFDRLPYRNAQSWDVAIAGYVQHGECASALALFNTMTKEGKELSKSTLLHILKACGTVKSAGQCWLIHDQMIRNELELDIVIGSALIDLYCKCESVESARRLFDDLPNRDVVLWGAMIAGYVRLGYGLSALELFMEMQEDGIQPSKITFSCILKACGSIRASRQGQLIHDQVTKSGFELDVIVGSSLVDMYGKFSSLQDAGAVFHKLPDRDVISWGAIIAGCAAHGYDHSAFELFEEMRKEGIEPDNVVFSSLLKACGTAGAIGWGRLIYDQIIRSELELDVVLGNSLLDMYAKCGSLEEMKKVLDKLPERDVVSWGVVIGGCAAGGDGFLVLELLRKMQQEDIKPNGIIFLSTLKACSNLGAIGWGRFIHEQIIKIGLEPDVSIGNTLVDLYAKSGSLKDAQNIFDNLPTQNVVSWASMIRVFSCFGGCRVAGQCLDGMQQQGLNPVDTNFTNILSACSHAGLLKEGLRYFKGMRDDHGILPLIEQYGCMVDLFGRAGWLMQAKDLLLTMPVCPDILMWTSLLSSCRTYGNAQIGTHCFDEIVHLNHNDASGYMLMSNMYTEALVWDKADKIQKM